VQLITGFVERYTWQPGEKIFAGEEGKLRWWFLMFRLSMLTRDSQSHGFNELIAGAPKEAMGFRTLVKRLNTIVQMLETLLRVSSKNKIKQFEEQIIEPILNAMLN